jgi:hypothetical protein
MKFKASEIFQLEEFFGFGTCVNLHLTRLERKRALDWSAGGSPATAAQAAENLANQASFFRRRLVRAPALIASGDARAPVAFGFLCVSQILYIIK